MYWQKCAEGLLKIGSDFAAGLPEKEGFHAFPEVKEPRQMELGVHRHLAAKAGEHLDLRLGDKETGHAHSWAIRNWPKPGEVSLAVRQPTHTTSYMDFQGEITKGYGKGKVELARRGQAEVLRADSKHVRFNFYDGKKTEEYVMFATPKQGEEHWGIRNVTKTRETKELPSSKPKYKSIEPGHLNPDNPNTVLQAKIDGAHCIFSFDKPHSQARVFSYRPTERETGVIEHTHRIPDYRMQRTPPGLRDTILRGEIYAEDGKGKALPPQRVGGMLNAGVWRSREKQQEEGKLTNVVFDVVKWHGQDVSNAPYSQKAEMLQDAVKQAPWLKLPRTATTPAGKRKLIADIKNGKEPSTIEGVVEWHKDKPIPAKAKFRPEVDVFVKSIFPEKSSRGMAGGFAYSKTLGGPVAGKVGTGFNHGLKHDMMKRPEKYEGLQARIKVIPGHEGRAPAFLSWHLDQELPVPPVTDKIASMQELETLRQQLSKIGTGKMNEYAYFSLESMEKAAGLGQSLKDIASTRVTSRGSLLPASLCGSLGAAKETAAGAQESYSRYKNAYGGRSWKKL